MSTIGCERLPACGEPARRAHLRDAGTLNGIDYVEVGADQRSLCVHLFGDVPTGMTVANVRVRGGRRITGIRVLSVKPDRDADMHDDPCLRVVLDRAGDHSVYCLCLVTADSPADQPDAWQPYEGFDPRYACAEFSFRLECAQDRDCEPLPVPCNDVRPAPAIDYLAKDYATFRRLLLDRLALTIPDWRERHVPDVGVALVELLAYRADRLSYYQDAVATEAYLDTARRRVSVRRHARLVDYRLHEGCNARALLTIATDTDVTLPLDAVAFAVPPPGDATAGPGVVAAERFDEARRQGALVFEPVSLDGGTTLELVAAHSAIRIYTWGDELCCLPRGSTRTTLLDERPGGDDTARVLQLEAGDLLIFEEVLHPRTGNAADADPTHRHAVRLTRVERTEDPLYGRRLLEVEWDARDALPFDLCLSARLPSPACTLLQDVSLARGNVVLVDHGEHVPVPCRCDELCAPPAADGAPPTPLARLLAVVPDACQRSRDLGEQCWLVPGEAEEDCCRCEDAVPDVQRRATLEPRQLEGTPLTFAEPIVAGAPASVLLQQDPRQALPAVTVHGGPLDAVLVPVVPDARWRWEARYDLLASGPDDQHFAVEIDDDGAAELRFGDGELGKRPQAGDFFRARVRVGNGPGGNVGRDSIVWLVPKAGALSGVTLLPRNPMPARGGTAPETIAEAKLYAPGAFRARPLRAVTAEDYAAFAAATPGVQGAGCALEWTGSWYEAHVVVDPLRSETLAPELATTIGAGLHRYRRIGHDVAVGGACYVPLTIVVDVCVLPDYLAAHVIAELADRFTAGLRRDGTPGFFHPDRLRLGAPVYVSRIVAEAQAVAGVAHVEVTTLARLDGGGGGNVLVDGILRLGGREIAQLNADPDFPEHGSIRFNPAGGR